MKTEDRRVCPSCGNEFSGAVELCPVCMLHGALADDVESGEPSSERGIKPKSQGVAPRFQHYELLIGDDGKPVELGRGGKGSEVGGLLQFGVHACQPGIVEGDAAGGDQTEQRDSEKRGYRRLL